MSRIAYRSNLRLRQDNQNRLNTIGNIVDEYSSAGHKLTLRQLYYQLVSRDIIPNEDSEYEKLSILLGKGRMAGRIDWDAIEDRLREPYLPYYSSGVSEAIESVARVYRLDRQESQDVYLEVWVEKDALSGVLRRVTSKYHVRLMVNRGYSSITAMHDYYMRLKDAVMYGMRPVILYLGDHDPSGLDMVRDARSRIQEFIDGDCENDGDWRMAVQDAHSNLDVIHIALTMDQIKKYNPPPNPAKVKDPRAKRYISEFGHVSWEVDALPPDTLLSLVDGAIAAEIDLDTYKSVVDSEKPGRARLYELAESE